MNAADSYIAAFVRAEQLATELSARNAQAVRDWRLRRSLRIDCPDAWSAPWRARLNDWFEGERGHAQRWLFKRRCERQQSVLHSLGVDDIPVLLLRQGE